MWSTADMRAMDVRAMPTVAFAAVMAASVALVVTLDPLPVDGATGKAAQAEARSSISYVGGTPRDVDCSGQTWPYIERRCLVEAPPKVAVDRRPQMQVGTIDARKVTAAAPDVAAAAATDGSSAASDITASVPVAARVGSLENDDIQPAPIVVKKEKRSRRTPRQEQRPVSDEELAAAIEQDIAQPRAVASKRSRVVRPDRLEAAVRQLERMF